MPSSDKIGIDTTDVEAWLRSFDEALKVALKQDGFPSTLKSLKRGRVHAPRMMSVCEDVLEEQPSGLYEAALQTERGPVILRNAQRSDHRLADPQLVPFGTHVEDDTTTETNAPSHLLNRLSSVGADAPPKWICEAELTRFDASQHQLLLPLLWHYILRHRDSNSPEKLTAVGSAIRKYIAVMPMEQMGQLSILLEAGHKSVLPIEHEIEVAKMIYRNFEVHPPIEPDPHPELARRLWEMVQAYMNPRHLLRDRHSAVASLSILAIVAMRSNLAEPALKAAALSPYRWFAELVNDNLARLSERWTIKSPVAAGWLATLREHVHVLV